MNKKMTVSVTTGSGSEMEVELNFWKGKRVYNDATRDYYDIERKSFSKNGNTIINRQLTEIIEKELGE